MRVVTFKLTTEHLSTREAAARLRDRVLQIRQTDSDTCARHNGKKCMRCVLRHKEPVCDFAKQHSEQHMLDILHQDCLRRRRHDCNHLIEQTIQQLCFRGWIGRASWVSPEGLPFLPSLTPPSP